MSLDLLDTPLRLSWELHAGDVPMPARLADCVVERLLEAGVFFVTLERQPLRHPQIATILDRLSAGGCQSVVVCEGHPEELAALDAPLPLSQLFLNAAGWIETDGLQHEGLAFTVAAIRSKGFEPALLLVPKKENISLIPKLFALCQELGIGRIKLPNTPYDGSLSEAAARSLPDPGDLEQLALALAHTPINEASGVDLEIHDLFLWELLQPALGGERGEYGGCQAGNSLGHIDGLGRLHPCSSWPQVLGSMSDQSIEALWNSSLRYRIRAEIAASPEGCLGCGDYPICLGGCRGLARSLNRAAGGRDLLCRGLRPQRS